MLRIHTGYRAYFRASHDVLRYRPKNKPIYIIGVGGIGSGGRPRTAFNWTVYPHLSEQEQRYTILDTLRLREIIKQEGDGWRHVDGRHLTEAQVLQESTPEALLKGLFIRRLPADREIDARAFVELGITEFTIKMSQMPGYKEGLALGQIKLPPGWEIRGWEGEWVRIGLTEGTKLFGQEAFRNNVHFGGFIPDGVLRSGPTFPNDEKTWEDFLRYTLFACGDVLDNVGVSMEDMVRAVGETRVGIAYGSAQAGMGPSGLGDIFLNYLTNHHIGVKAVAHSLPDMAAAFASGYAFGPLGFLGPKSCATQACNTALANLEVALMRIRLGITDIELAGAVDFANYHWNRNAYARAVIKNETVESASNADWYNPGGRGILYPRASNPFGNYRNGFCMSEGAYLIALANADAVYKTGARILGMIHDVSNFSDGPTISPTKPGAGSYLAMRRILGSLEKAFGRDVLQERIFGVAHEASTGLGGVRESKLYNRASHFYGIPKLPLTAPKSWWGHSEGAAGCENFLVALYGLMTGRVPAIRNLKESGVGRDLTEIDRLNLLTDTMVSEPGHFVAAVINALGFGAGNGVGAIIGEDLANRHFREDYLPRRKRRSEAEYDARLKDTNAQQKQAEEVWWGGASKYLFNQLEFAPDEGKGDQVTPNFSFTAGGIRIENRPQGADISIP